MINWSSRCIDSYREISIFVRPHAIYEAYAFIGHTVYRIASTMIYLGKHSNFDGIDLQLTTDLSLNMLNTNNLLLLKRAHVFQSF